MAEEGNAEAGCDPKCGGSGHREAAGDSDSGAGHGDDLGSNLLQRSDGESGWWPWLLLPIGIRDFLRVVAPLYFLNLFPFH